MKKNKSISYYLNGVSDKLGRKLLPRYKRKWVTLFRYTNALGDALFLTTLAHEIKKRNPAAIVHVITGLPDVFLRNPDVDLVSHYDGKNVPGLGKFLIRYEHRFPWKQHLLRECARCVDIYDSIELKTYIYPSDEDIKWAKDFVRNLGSSPILINRTAGPRTDKKNWPQKYWEELIPELLKNHHVVEIGSQPSVPAIPVNSRFADLTGKTSLHQTAALMSESKLLICPVTGVLHLASAFNLPVICVLGGSEPAHATAYRNTFSIEHRPACADCYEKGPCNNDFICLKNISSAEVLAKVNSVIGK